MGPADDAAARSGRDRRAAGRGARLFQKRRAASAADASRSRSCRRHSGFSEREGACPSPRARHGGDAPDAGAEGPLHHRSVEAWSAMGVLRGGRRRLVRLQGRARARRSRARHPDDPAARPYAQAIAASPCGAGTNGCCTPAMPISSTARCRLRRKCRWCSACFSAAPTWIAPCASKTRSGYGRSRPITAMP